MYINFKNFTVVIFTNSCDHNRLFNKDRTKKLEPLEKKIQYLSLKTLQVNIIKKDFYIYIPSTNMNLEEYIFSYPNRF